MSLVFNIKKTTQILTGKRIASLVFFRKLHMIDLTTRKILHKRRLLNILCIYNYGEEYIQDPQEIEIFGLVILNLNKQYAEQVKTYIEICAKRTNQSAKDIADKAIISLIDDIASIQRNRKLEWTVFASPSLYFSLDLDFHLFFNDYCQRNFLV